MLTLRLSYVFIIATYAWFFLKFHKHYFILKWAFVFLRLKKTKGEFFCNQFSFSPYLYIFTKTSYFFCVYIPLKTMFFTTQTLPCLHHVVVTIYEEKQWRILCHNCSEEKFVSNLWHPVFPVQLRKVLDIFYGIRICLNSQISFLKFSESKSCKLTFFFSLSYGKSSLCNMKNDCRGLIM